MLTRVLETEVMDKCAEAVDYDAMDHREVNRRFVADWIAVCQSDVASGLSDPLDGELLDLGTGTAQIPIELCRRHLSTHVRAVDLAEPMLALAANNVARADLSERIVLERADAKRLSYVDGRFTAVLSNSIVHHIAEPRQVLAEAVRVAVPGGRLFVRDLLRPADASTLALLVDAYTAGANAHQRQMFADSLHAALTLEEVRELVVSLGFEPQSVQATSDRHWTWSARHLAAAGSTATIAAVAKTPGR